MLLYYCLLIMSVFVANLKILVVYIFIAICFSEVLMCYKLGSNQFSLKHGLSDVFFIRVVFHQK